MSSATGRRWRLADLLEESGRRAGAGVILLLVVAGLVAVVLIAMSAGTLQRAFAQQRAELAMGRDVWVLTFSETDPAPAATCEQLPWTSSAITASGARLDAQTSDATMLATGQRLPTTTITPGALAVWWPSGGVADGLLLGRDAAQAYDLSPAVPITLGSTQSFIAAVLPETVAPAVLQSSLVIVAPPAGTTRECWVRMEPHAQDGVTELLAAGLSMQQELFLAAPYLPEDTLRATPSQIAAEPTIVHIGVGAATILLAVLAGALLDRREMGIYRLTGTLRSDLLLMWLIPITVAGIAAASLALAAAAIALALPLGIPAHSQTWWYLLQPAIAALTAALVFAAPLLAVVMTSAVINQLKSA